MVVSKGSELEMILSHLFEDPRVDTFCRVSLLELGFGFGD